MSTLQSKIALWVVTLVTVSLVMKAAAQQQAETKEQRDARTSWFREILANYGESPDVLWWDTPRNINTERTAKILNVIKKNREGADQ